MREIDQLGRSEFRNFRFHIKSGSIGINITINQDTALPCPYPDQLLENDIPISDLSFLRSSIGINITINQDTALPCPYPDQLSENDIPISDLSFLRSRN